MKELVKEDGRPMFTVRDWNFTKGEEKVLHLRGGRTTFILIQMVRITRQRMCSCAARPKLWGKNIKIEKEEFEFSTEGQKKVLKIKRLHSCDPFAKSSD